MHPTAEVKELSAESRTVRWCRIAAVLVVVTGLVLAYRSGVFDRFAEPARVARTLIDLGPWGYLAFVAAYAAFQPFGVPGTVFVVAAALIWPWPVAFALSMTGTMAASVVGFSFARLVARDWVSRRIPARFRKYDEALAVRAFATVFFLRLVFWMPPLLHAFFGVSKVRFWTHFWASLAGYVLPLLLVSFFGQRLFDAARDMPTGAWIGLAGAVAILGLGVWALRRRTARAAQVARG
jgi:uncharacterized membrane protein YdjX (TVP38/TMEM64 family)